jgi:hypothetical protein
VAFPFVQLALVRLDAKNLPIGKRRLQQLLGVELFHRRWTSRSVLEPFEDE